MYRTTSYFLFFACFSICYSLNTNKSAAKEYNETRKENIRNCLEKVAKVNKKSEGVKLYRNCFNNKVVNIETTRNGDSDKVISDKINITKYLNSDPASQSNVNKRNDSISNRRETDLMVYNFGDVLKFGPNQNFKDGDIVVNVDCKRTGEMARGKTGSNTQLFSYALVPALLLAGIMPWVMPGLQLAASVVAMINQIAFTSSLFTLIRSYIFDSRPEEHVVYVNHGYKKNKKQYHPHR